MENLENLGVKDLGLTVVDINGGCGQFRAGDMEGGHDHGWWWCVFCWIDAAYE